MKNRLQLPLDFLISRSNDVSVEKQADLIGLKIKKDGYFYIGEVRLGLSSFLKEGEVVVFPSEIENRVDEMNGAGSSIWKHFMKDTERNIPEAWDYNLYFGTFFISKDPSDHQDKFMFYLKKSSNGGKRGPMFKQVSINFAPRENDRLVCVVY